MKIEKHSYVTKINLYIIKGSLVEKLPSYRALYIYTLVIQRCVTEHAVSAKYTDNCRFWPYCATYLQNFVGSLWLSCLPNKTARQHVLLCLTTYVSARASNFCHSCACMGCMMHVCKTVFRSGGHDISTRADSNIRQHYAVGAQTAVQGTALDPYGSALQQPVFDESADPVAYDEDFPSFLEEEEVPLELENARNQILADLRAEERAEERRDFERNIGMVEPDHNSEEEDEIRRRLFGPLGDDIE